MYIQANIGRNATWNRETGEARTMVNDVWHAFQRDVQEEIWLSVHDVDIPTACEIVWSDFQTHTGTGEWDGVPEESAHVSVYFYTRPGQINAARLQEHLSDRLSHLARQYGQDAIAFVVTDSHLATR